MTRVIQIALAVLALSLASGPAVAGERPAILVADPWCPHTCDPRQGKAGYMIEIAREALALSGIETVYKTEGWARAMLDVRQGRADGAVGALPDEAPDLVTNQEPLGVQSNAFVVQSTDPFHMDGLDSLLGRRIGAVTDYSYSPKIDAWLVAHSDAVQAINGNHTATRNLNKLLAGRVDVVVDDEAVIQDALFRMGRSDAVRVAGREPGGTLHIAFGRTRGKALRDALDSGIRAMRANGRLAAIRARYNLPPESGPRP